MIQFPAPATLMTVNSRLLALHPAVQRELQVECLALSSHQTGGLPTKGELKNMSYLKKVINEGI